MNTPNKKETVNIMNLVSLLRSKNAGPVYFGFDIIFKDKKSYDLGKKYINKSMIAELYSIPLERVISIIPYDPGRGIKITILRQYVSGEPGDNDVFGAQQHVPLMSIEIPQE